MLFTLGLVPKCVSALRRVAHTIGVAHLIASCAIEWGIDATSLTTLSLDPNKNLGTAVRFTAIFLSTSAKATNRPKPRLTKRSLSRMSLSRFFS